MASSKENLIDSLYTHCQKRTLSTKEIVELICNDVREFPNGHDREKIEDVVRVYKNTLTNLEATAEELYKIFNPQPDINLSPYSIDPGMDLKNYYSVGKRYPSSCHGRDAEVELLNILANKIQKTIDESIVERSVKFLAERCPDKKFEKIEFKVVPDNMDQSKVLALPSISNMKITPIEENSVEEVKEKIRRSKLSRLEILRNLTSGKS